MLTRLNEFIQKENEQSEQKQIQAMLTRRPYVRNPLCDMNEEELDREAEQSVERMGYRP